MFSRWISLNGVSRGTRTSGRRSLSVTSAARVIRLSAKPCRIAASVFMLHGTTTMPDTGYDPDETVAPNSPNRCVTSAS